MKRKQKGASNGHSGSARVTVNARATRERRERLAASFRERLAAELGADGSSVARDALAEVAVGSFVEISELTARFLRGRASDAAMSRLSSARLSLTRALRLLHVAAAPSSEPPGEPKGGIADYLRGRDAPDSEETDA